MTLGSTQPLIQTSIFWGNDGHCAGLTTLHLHLLNVYKLWEPQIPGTLGTVQVFNRTDLPPVLHYI